MVRHFIHLSSGESILVFTLAQVWSTKLVCKGQRETVSEFGVVLLLYRLTVW